MSAGSDKPLRDIAARAVDAALAAGATDAEAVVEDSRECTVRVYGGRVESLTEAGSRGLGVRAWIDGRVGYSYGSDLSDDGVARIAGGAVDAAAIADVDEFAAAPRIDGDPAEVPGLVSPSLIEASTEEKVELAKAVEAAASAAASRVRAVETSVYADEIGRQAIVSSAGADAEFEAGFAYAYTHAIATGQGDERQTGLGFGLGRGPELLDPQAIGAEAAGRAEQLLGAEKPASRTVPVVLTPTVAASFLGFIGGVLGADAVQRGRSPFASKLGERIGSGIVSLVDDGLDPEGMASAPVDGEGLARRRTTLIDGGVLSAFLHDSYTARREGGDAVSTANAARSGYRSSPGVKASNLVLTPGGLSEDELVAAAGDGVYITDVAGLHSGVNPVTGQFSVGASGLLIENGRLAGPVSEFTIASDFVSLLLNIEAIGADPRWVPFGGSVKTPPLLISRIAIAGT